MTLEQEGLGHLGWSRDVMAEAEVHRALNGTAVDDPPLTHTRAGTMWQGQEVDHPSMGLGWHA